MEDVERKIIFLTHCTYECILFHVYVIVARSYEKDFCFNPASKIQNFLSPSKPMQIQIIAEEIKKWKTQRGAEKQLQFGFQKFIVVVVVVVVVVVHNRNVTFITRSCMYSQIAKHFLMFFRFFFCFFVLRLSCLIVVCIKAVIPHIHMYACVCYHYYYCCYSIKY